jgi:hypothetical protein
MQFEDITPQIKNNVAQLGYAPFKNRQQRKGLFSEWLRLKNDLYVNLYLCKTGRFLPDQEHGRAGRGTAGKARTMAACVHVD